MSGIRDEHRVLVDRYVDDLSSPEEVARLNQLLAENPEVADYFAGVARLNNLLLERAREEVAARTEAAAAAVDEAEKPRKARGSSSRRRPPGSRRKRAGLERRRAAGRRRPKPKFDRRRRRPSPGWLVAAGAAAAAAIVLAVFLTRKEPLPAVPAWTAQLWKFRGKPRVYRKAEEIALKSGTILRPGDRVLTDKGSLLAFRYDDGTVVELNRGSRLTLGKPPRSKELIVDSGDLYVTAARQPGGHPLVVNRGRYDQVVVIGTQFEISRSDSASVLKVAEGRVRFGTGAKLAVPEGHACRVSRGGQPQGLRPTEIAGIAPWRRNRPPWVEPVKIRTGRNMPARVVLMAGDPDGDHLTYELTQLPKHGKISGTAPDLIYEPAEGFSGDDELRVKVGDGLAESEEVKIPLEVTAPKTPPTAALEAGPRRGKAPLTVNFYAQGSRAVGGGKVTCTWDFGDGSRGEGMTTKHVYRKPGKFTAKLSVRDEHGGLSERKFLVEVLDKDAVNAPGPLKWHYQKETNRFYLSWRDNSDNETGFFVEKALKVKDAKPEFKRVAELGAGITLWRIKFEREDSGNEMLFRVRALNAERERVSAPSNTVRIGLDKIE